jgi:hypothetical protein
VESGRVEARAELEFGGAFCGQAVCTPRTIRAPNNADQHPDKVVSFLKRYLSTRRPACEAAAMPDLSSTALRPDLRGWQHRRAR